MTMFCKKIIPIMIAFLMVFAFFTTQTVLAEGNAGTSDSNVTSLHFSRKKVTFSYDQVKTKDCDLGQFLSVVHLNSSFDYTFTSDIPSDHFKEIKVDEKEVSAVLYIRKKHA